MARLTFLVDEPLRDHGNRMTRLDVEDTALCFSKLVGYGKGEFDSSMK
jgi:hypothetical protein